MKKTIRIGSGAGYGGDRLEPALTLLEKGNLDYIGFEGLAERTIALAQKSKQKDPSSGYNPLLAYRMEKALPLAYQNKVKVITNMGAANPLAALHMISEMATRMHLKGLKIAAILGDDIFYQIENYLDFPILETGHPLSTLSGKLLSANAYLGIPPILKALEISADIIITGRVADPALFLAPMVYEFGWKSDDYEKLGKGTLVGHLLECAGQVSGGYFADPGKKDIPSLWELGFPYAEVNESGDGFISKVEGTGGVINTATCTEQMIYEIHDPAQYVTPDCVADFSRVQFNEIDKDKVAFIDAGGTPATDTFKVSVGYHNGYFGEGQMSYGGANCYERALLACDIVKKRLELQQVKAEDLQLDIIGVNALFPSKELQNTPNEVRIRVSGRTKEKSDAQKIANEVETLYTNGPAGGGGATKQVEEVISVVSILVPKSDIQTDVIYQEI
ncbi:MAG: acyclic terpene utilization AtuA family protein [Bacteroidia bacterium]